MICAKAWSKPAFNSLEMTQELPSVMWECHFILWGIHSRLQSPWMQWGLSQTCYFSEQGCPAPVSLPLDLASGRYMQEDKGEGAAMFPSSRSCFTTTGNGCDFCQVTPFPAQLSWGSGKHNLWLVRTFPLASFWAVCCLS